MLCYIEIEGRDMVSNRGLNAKETRVDILCTSQRFVFESTSAQPGFAPTHLNVPRSPSSPVAASTKTASRRSPHHTYSPSTSTQPTGPLVNTKETDFATDDANQGNMQRVTRLILHRSPALPPPPLTLQHPTPNTPTVPPSQPSPSAPLTSPP